jgi:uncharacterized Ntn-hydrolase superfamily protein
MQLKSSSQNQPKQSQVGTALGHAAMTICGRCPDTGQLGFATASTQFAVGANAAYARGDSGITVIHGKHTLEFHRQAHQSLLQGQTADKALQFALETNTTPHQCQAMALDTSGNSKARTGKNLLRSKPPAWGGDLCSENVSVAGFGLGLETIVPAIMAKFKQTAQSGLLLSERLLLSLERGLEVAGPMPELKASALYIIGEDRYPLIDLRIDDKAKPLAALRHLFEDYMREDIKLDAYLPTKDDPHGLAPTTFDEAARYFKRLLRYASRPKP